MKGVILAAGQGSRLGGEGPKPLALLDDHMTILDDQIRQLERFLSKENLLITVGYEKEAITSKFKGIHFVDTPDYAHENTAKSLEHALESINGNHDLIWMNGDVLFRPDVLRKLFSVRRNSMAVNRAQVGKEEVKYITHEGRITRVAKELANGEGEAVGINFLLAEAVEPFKEELKKTAHRCYFEKALEGIIQRGIEIFPCYIEEDSCIEIDFPEDLEKAKILFKNWYSAG